MKMSAGVEWAVHCCVVLSQADEPVSAQRLAEFHGVSRTYLAKHLQQLSRAGLVASHRGAGRWLHADPRRCETSPCSTWCWRSRAASRRSAAPRSGRTGRSRPARRAVHAAVWDRPRDVRRRGRLAGRTGRGHDRGPRRRGSRRTTARRRSCVSAAGWPTPDRGLSGWCRPPGSAAGRGRSPSRAGRSLTAGHGVERAQPGGQAAGHRGSAAGAVGEAERRLLADRG